MTELTPDQRALLEEMGRVEIDTPDQLNGVVGSFRAACQLDGLGVPDHEAVKAALAG